MPQFVYYPIKNLAFVGAKNLAFVGAPGPPAAVPQPAQPQFASQFAPIPSAIKRNSSATTSGAAVELSENFDVSVHSSQSRPFITIAVKMVANHINAGDFKTALEEVRSDFKSK